MAASASAPIALVSDPHASSSPERIAALDLGSNSFHLVLAWVQNGIPHVYDRRREHVALGTQLVEGEPLNRDARARAIACFHRLGTLLKPLPAARVRIVGTDALRRASDGASLRRQGRKLLGHPIELVPGDEEARLIWRGVNAMRPPQPTERRLVLDIGGGSTELIAGMGFEIEEARSTPMGCIRFSEQFFPEGRLSKKRYGRAREAALLLVRSFVPRMQTQGVHLALGSSGTVRSIGEVLAANDWSPAPSSISRSGLSRLIETMLEEKSSNDLQIRGLSDDRRPVLPGGLAIVDAVMSAFELEHMEVAEGALREGLLMEIVNGAETGRDLRDASVEALAARHGVDGAHAARVRASAEHLFDQVAEDWALDGNELRRWLGWAAELHEIGLSVAHTGVARHGAYLIRHADAPGFSTGQLDALARLVRTHRGRLEQDDEAPSRVERRTLARLGAILRLAVALHADRRTASVRVSAKARKKRLTITLAQPWLEQHPLVALDLRGHARQLRKAGLKLEVEIPAR
jgi:exopolyphosphatase/guanosine-5'-triphosphate,3'-diphosphate pyrophosphatase